MITLGTRIVYSHEAAVARRPKIGKDWDFPKKGNGDVPKLYRHGDGYTVLRFAPNIENIPAEHHSFTPGRHAPEEDLLEKINKSVMVYEMPGSGVVTGLVNKQVGISEGSSGYDENFDQGWFVRYGAVDLYVVRHELRGAHFVYVPLWAARPMDLEVAA